MLESLKKEVFEANLELPKRGLIKYTWGNVSVFDSDTKYFVIKPSGVSYEEMTVDDMVVVDLNNNVIEGKMNPSSDTPTHAVLYKAFPEISAIVHTHSTWATIWAQAGVDVPAMGTTHADTFYGEVPCARYLTKEEIDEGYEHNTGLVIVDEFSKRGIKPLEVPGVLLHGHGPFTWGKSAKEAVMNTVVLEEVCKMNFYTRQLNSYAEVLPQRVLDKHYLRKHGKDAYYGQN
ncbi:L-ribulose-5-phosphate 4-epimerase [Enterococcus sp. DIV0187]|uniref:L-ribulose-5-phosphate 4-epimerase n=1 Tax=Enterococcus sp. DIV0187 TaxID=2774644 RepID=UPI003F271791